VRREPAGEQRCAQDVEALGRRRRGGGQHPGKSHLCEALGHAVIEAGMRVAWFSLESLTATITRARVDASVSKVVARICRSELIVIDNIGMLPSDQDAAEAFYRVVDAAYEKRSLAVTSNLHPPAFDTIMPKALATASVERLLHHAHLIVTDVPSLRLAEATAGQGVVPLA
jgi:DNA replication protein DnaC